MKLKEVVKRIKAFRDSSTSPHKNNINIFLVGGVVRDEVMNVSAKDFDYLITGLSQEEFEKLFPEAKMVGAGFPVYLMDVDGDKETEFALARTEKKDGVGYNGFTAITDPSLTVEDDLLRRDLTINALAKNVETGEIIDPFGGKKDIEEKIIRATSEAFKEDPLRVYRAARFASRYGFRVEKNTLSLMKGLKGELIHLPGERILLELSKTLKEGKPSVFFKVLKEIEVLDVHFSELNNKSSTLFEKTMKKIDNLDSKNENERFAVLTSEFTEEEIISFSFKLKVTIEAKQLALFVARNKEKLAHFNTLNEKEIIALLMEINKHPLTKQAESLKKVDYLFWFKNAVKVLKDAEKDNSFSKDTVEKISFLALEVKKVKINPEEVKGLIGKEIGEFLEKKMIEKVKKITL